MKWLRERQMRGSGEKTKKFGRLSKIKRKKKRTVKINKVV